jgi:hypothetical protein
MPEILAHRISGNHDFSSRLCDNSPPLGSSWASWFEGTTIRHEKSGLTVLTGPPADEPALYGVLAKIRDLGLPLVCLLVLSWPTEANLGF